MQGYLLKQNYPNGFFVQKGQLLYEIDPRPFVASPRPGEGTGSVAVAQLSEAENNVTRDTPLAAQNAIPQKQLDTDLATLAANQAQVDAAKAHMVQAELNLSWTKVYSPIDGIAGNCRLADRRPGRDEHQDDDCLPGQSDPGVLQYQRERLPWQRQQNCAAGPGKGDKSESFPVEFIQANGYSLPAEGQDHSGQSRGRYRRQARFSLRRSFPIKRHSTPWRLWQCSIETGTNKNAHA